jgi:hypothetical protein
MITSSTYEQIKNILTRKFQLRYKSKETYPTRMVAILFARPDLEVAKKYILPNLNYFNIRAGSNIDFFCIGYRKNSSKVSKIYDRLNVVTIDNKNWNFSSKIFNDFRTDFEMRTKWSYSGGVDLILLNTEFDNNEQKVVLDFSSAISMQLDSALNDKAIDSVEAFFEKICKFAEEYDVQDPVWKFSDSIGVSKGKQELIDRILSLIPNKFGDSIKKVSYFRVKDIS